MSNQRARSSNYARVVPYRAARIDRPSYMWSQRDWTVFRASCAQTERQRLRAVDVVSRFRSGEAVASIAEAGVVSRQYVYQMLAAEDLRDARLMGFFYGRRRNLGRPIDMGGPRDEWIDHEMIDDQDASER